MPIESIDFNLFGDFRVVDLDREGSCSEAASSKPGGGVILLPKKNSNRKFQELCQKKIMKLKLKLLPITDTDIILVYLIICF